MQHEFVVLKATAEILEAFIWRNAMDGDGARATS